MPKAHRLRVHSPALRKGRKEETVLEIISEKCLTILLLKIQIKSMYFSITLVLTESNNT